MSIYLSQSTTQFLKNKISDFSENERIRAWQAFGERVALTFLSLLQSSVCQNSPWFQTASFRAESVSNTQTHSSLKSCLACPSSLPTCIILFPQHTPVLSPSRNTCSLKALGTSVSVNPHCHPIRHAIISFTKDGKLRLIEVKYLGQDQIAEKRLCCPGCSGSKGCALNCELKCPTELTWAPLICRVTHERKGDPIPKTQHREQGLLVFSPGSLPMFSVTWA